MQGGVTLINVENKKIMKSILIWYLFDYGVVKKFIFIVFP